MKKGILNLEGSKKITRKEQCLIYGGSSLGDCRNNCVGDFQGGGSSYRGFVLCLVNCVPDVT